MSRVRITFGPHAGKLGVLLEDVPRGHEVLGSARWARRAGALGSARWGKAFGLLVQLDGAPAPIVAAPGELERVGVQRGAHEHEYVADPRPDWDGVFCRLCGFRVPAILAKLPDVRDRMVQSTPEGDPTP